MQSTRTGLLEVWDFRTRFAPLMEWDPPPSLEALQRAAIAPGNDGAAAFVQLLGPLIADVRSLAAYAIVQGIAADSEILARLCERAAS